MKPIIFLSLPLLISCSTFDKIKELSYTAIQVPQARMELVAYLPPDRLALIQDDIRVLDKSYQPIADAVFGNQEIALPAIADRQKLKSAFLAIQAQVLAHRAQSLEPIPETLSEVADDLEMLWNDWDRVLEKNQKAAEYLRLVAGLVAL